MNEIAHKRVSKAHLQSYSHYKANRHHLRRFSVSFISMVTDVGVAMMSKQGHAHKEYDGKHHHQRHGNTNCVGGLGVWLQLMQ